MKNYHSLLIFVLMSTFCFGQQLSEVEKKIIATVNANNDEAIEFLKGVVNLNSGTLNLEGVKAVGDYMAKGFEEIGFETSWIEMPAEMNRAGHLFAETKGDSGK